MSNSISALEESIINYSKKCLLSYENAINAALSRRTSIEDLVSKITGAQSYYFNEIFNCMQKNLSDIEQQKVQFALKNINCTGLAESTLNEVIKRQDLTAGMIFAIFNYVYNGTASNSPALLSKMRLLDQKQLQLMESVWKKVLDNVKAMDEESSKSRNKSDTNQSQNNSVKFCRKCGCQLQPDSIYCYKCGTRVV